MPRRSIRKLSINGGSLTWRWIIGLSARISSVKLGHEATDITSSSSSIWERKCRIKIKLIFLLRIFQNHFHSTLLWLKSRYWSSGNAGKEMSSSSVTWLAVGVMEPFSSSSSKMVLLIRTSELLFKPCWKKFIALLAEFAQQKEKQRSINSPWNHDFSRKRLISLTRTNIFTLHCCFRKFLNDLPAL